MNFESKITNLRAKISEQLKPLIHGRKVALFGLPCHGNMGDTYISLGEFAFIKDCRAQILYMKMLIDSSSLPDLPDDCVILLQGGGDFGDVWRGIQDVRLSVIQYYATHKIIIFPQTVFYENNLLCQQDVDILKRCPDLTICVRDYKSYEFALKFFHNNILLVPDMAFYISVENLRKYKVKPNLGTLYLKRVDKEFNNEQTHIPSDAIVSDWPTVGNRQFYLQWNLRLIGYADGFRIRNINFMSHLLRKLAVWEMLHVAYPLVEKLGVRFLSSYENLYLTRLHGAIVSTLLGKEFYLIDNSYHKNLYFYETWLSDLDGAHLISK